MARSVRAADTSTTCSGLKAGAVLHRVHQHLAEREHQRVALRVVHVGAVPRHEVDQPLGRDEPAGDPQRDPVRQPGEHLNTFAPRVLGERGAQHVGDVLHVERRGKAREDVRAQGGDEIGLWCHGREHDDACARADLPDLRRERDVLHD